MLSYNQIKTKSLISLGGEPYEVLSTHVFRKQQRRPVNQTKLKHLKTGKVISHTFHQRDSVEEADVETKSLVYIYSDKNLSWFHEKGDSSKRSSVPKDIVGTQISFLKEKTPVDALLFEEKIIGIRIPIKMILVVTETPPGIKGNTAQGGTKQATLESGAVVSVPLFINEGDKIVVNTETGEYVQRK